MTARYECGQVWGGRYRLERQLGSGGAGVVWEATHALTGKRVALKLLQRDNADSPDVRRRLIREARAACAIGHPNVIQVHDVIEIEGEPPVLVMDLLEGETLARKLEREGKLELGAFTCIVLPVLSAVSAAHALGILHRDLKPENIFLCKGGPPEKSVRVLDFGLAKLPELTTRSAGITNTGQLLGTPYYMAPEQVFGEKDIDGRADIWSLGIVFYECLSGRLPTEASNVGQVLKRITTGALSPLREVAPWIPQDIAALVDRMLAVDRNARPADIAVVRTALERHGIDAPTRVSVLSWSAAPRGSNRAVTSGLATAIAAGFITAALLAVGPTFRSRAATGGAARTPLEPRNGLTLPGPAPAGLTAHSSARDALDSPRVPAPPSPAPPSPASSKPAEKATARSQRRQSAAPLAKGALRSVAEPATSARSRDLFADPD